jgi:hypothetical protein
MPSSLWVLWRQDADPPPGSASFLFRSSGLCRKWRVAGAITRCQSCTDPMRQLGRHNANHLRIWTAQLANPWNVLLRSEVPPVQKRNASEASSIAPGHPLRRRLRESPRIAHPRSGGDLRDQVKADGLRNSGRGLGASTTFMACVCRRSATEMTRLATRSTRPCCSC